MVLFQKIAFGLAGFFMFVGWFCIVSYLIAPKTDSHALAAASIALALGAIFLLSGVLALWVNSSRLTHQAEPAASKTEGRRGGSVQSPE